MSLFLGLDVGGTFVKGVIIDKTGKLITEGSVPTVIGEGLADCLADFSDSLVRQSGKKFSDMAGLGVCCPGIIDSANGVVVFAANMELQHYPLKQLMEERLHIRTEVCNDANGAALGEARFGAGKGYSDSVLITLGTGIGSGIIINGKIFEGNKGAGAEVGHMVIERGGDKCTCGRRGCFEAYCSARALTARTKWAMTEDTSSEMWKKYSLNSADGRTAFEFMDCDRSARQVVDWYVQRLGCGLANVANIFRPQVIMIGGGVAAQGSRLTIPLQKIVDGEILGGADYAPVAIECARLGNRAGAYGAAALLM